MKKSFAAMLGLLVLTAVLAGGCKKSDGPDEAAPNGVTNEMEAMNYFSANDQFVVNDEQTYVDDAIETPEYGNFGAIAKTDAAVTPLRWGRFVKTVTRTVTTVIQPGDTMAIAHVEKTIDGILKIRARNAGGDTVTIEKPFTDKAKRNIIFKRVDRNVNKFWLNWLPVASSLVEGGTVAPHNDIEITRMSFLLANGDSVVVTNPEAHFLRYRWLRLWNVGQLGDVPELQGGQAIVLRVTVKSKATDADMVALRYGFDLFHRRRVMLTLVAESPDGTGFVRVYETARTLRPFVHFHKGYFHLAVDAMTKATLFDDNVSSYSVSWWGIPYRVF